MYNGHKNWNHWNVSLWINNDETLYNLALDCVRSNMSRVHSDRAKAVDDFMAHLPIYTNRDSLGRLITPDGALYSKSSVRAAMVGMKP